MEYARVDLPDPLGPMIAWVSPDATARSTPFRISFASSPVPTVTRRSRISSFDIRSVLLFGAEAQAGLDGDHDLALQVRDADSVDDVGEEAADDEPAGLLLRDSARLQIEQLQVVESSRRAGVPGADDLAR